MELLRRLEAEARSRLPQEVFDYFAGAAGDERTLAENEEAWARVWLAPRQLLGLGAADASGPLLGVAARAPVVLAPAAALALLHPDGELGAAGAAAEAGLPFCLSTRATCDLADVARGAPDGVRWFQLYMDRDRARVARQLERARAHGFTQIVMTVDLPVAGRRERERRNGPVALPDGVALASHLGGPGSPRQTKPAVGGWYAPTWEDVAWVGEAGELPVVLKGVLTGEDARLAAEAGASAVVVSNHGGRQLDGVVPTAVALREVVAALEGVLPVLVDGGIRSGADVVRALALGADAVMVGRPWLWGLAAEGREGVARVLRELVEDVERTLALVGAATPRDVEPSHVRLRGWG